MGEGRFHTELFECEWISATRKTPRSKQKLMIVLHGKGDTLEAFRSIKSELRLPNFNYLLLNAPKKYLKGFSWYALNARYEVGVGGTRRRIFKLIEELKAEGWKTKDIYFIGHSEGAMMAADVVLNHADSFGGLVGVSGYVRFFRGWKKQVTRSGARKTPWLFTHGLRDRIIEPREIREDIEELSVHQLPVLYREFMKGHDFDYRKEVPFIRKWIANHRVRRQSFLKPQA